MLQLHGFLGLHNRSSVAKQWNKKCFETALADANPISLIDSTKSIIYTEYNMCYGFQTKGV